jgi:amino acid transporter
VFCAWGLQIGWGTRHLSSLASSAENPAFVLAHRVWGAGWVLVLLALLNSGIAVCIACTVDSTRNWYAMARSEALPRWVAFIHPEHRTPSNAVFAQAALALLVGLGGGWLVGPDNIFYLLGTVGTLVYVVVYTLGNIGVVRFFLTVRRQDFNPPHLSDNFDRRALRRRLLLVGSSAGAPCLLCPSGDCGCHPARVCRSSEVAAQRQAGLADAVQSGRRTRRSRDKHRLDADRCLGAAC